jgi:RNA polymerase sigma factor (TIGR02999 family)
LDQSPTCVGPFGLEGSSLQDAPTVTQLLDASREGSREARDRLFTLLYDELRRVAHRQLFGQQPDATLDTTALIHEAFLRMVDQDQVDWADRAHFFAYAARTMRTIIVDYARRRGAQKRGGRLKRISFDDPDLPIDAQAEAIVVVDDALTQLAAINERLCRVVECRFFGGMSIEETAAALSVTDRTVRRDWLKAKAWLYDALYGATAG